MTTEEKAIAVLKMLPPEKQQAALTFLESLQDEQKTAISESQISALEMAGHLVGCLEGEPSDLSTNKQYMQGFGA